jgi:hypothetical protein
MSKPKRGGKTASFGIPSDANPPSHPTNPKDTTKPTNPLDPPTPHNLLLNENYKEEMKYEVHEILDKYVSLLTEYSMFLVEKIALKNAQLRTFVFIRGLDTITHVFNGLLFYTKNAELAFYHSQKAFYFYAEFIEQISDTQNSFLKLSSRDAVLFVYKRTLFELHNEFIKHPNDTQSFMHSLDPYYNIYRGLACSFFCHSLNHCDNKEKTTSCVSEFTKKMIAFSKRLNYLIVDGETLARMQSAVAQRYDDNIDACFNAYETLITKVSKGQSIH